VSSAGDGSDGADDVRAHDAVLGYLLKHAHQALERRCEAALVEVGVNTRELGVLRVIASAEASIDSLQRRRIVARRQAEHDRRRNVIDLTDEGWRVFRRAEQLSVQVERAFTSPLGEAAAADLRRTLRTMLASGAAS
jgi:hypothetical protein